MWSFTYIVFQASCRRQDIGGSDDTKCGGPHDQLRLFGCINQRDMLDLDAQLVEHLNSEETLI